MNERIRAAIYARVSTLDQKHDMQLTELRTYAKRMGFLVIEYSEKMSSVKKRPVFEKLLEDARLRKFDVVLVWKLDRFARSMRQFIESVLALDAAGVRFIAVTQGIDTDKQNPTGKFLMHILAAFAELERNMIVERVRAGVKEAQRRGKHCGRPPRIFHRGTARELQKKGMSLRAIAAKLSIPLSTLADALKPVRKVSR